AIAGLRRAALVLRTDRADEIGIDDDDVGFDGQGPESGHDQIMRHLAVRPVGRPVVARQPDPGMRYQRAGLAAGRRAGRDFRRAAWDVGPLVLLDPDAAA